LAPATERGDRTALEVPEAENKAHYPALDGLRAVAVLMVFLNHYFDVFPGAAVLDTIGYTLIDLFAGLLILLSLTPGSDFYRPLALKPLRRLGQISYGFYVFHDIPHSAYTWLVLRLNLPAPRLALPIVAFLGTISLSYLSFRFYETPFLRLKRRFTNESPGELPTLSLREGNQKVA